MVSAIHTRKEHVAGNMVTDSNAFRIVSGYKKDLELLEKFFGVNQGILDIDGNSWHKGNENYKLGNLYLSLAKEHGGYWLEHAESIYKKALEFYKKAFPLEEIINEIISEASPTNQENDYKAGQMSRDDNLYLLIGPFEASLNSKKINGIMKRHSGINNLTITHMINLRQNLNYRKGNVIQDISDGIPFSSIPENYEQYTIPKKGLIDYLTKIVKQIS